MGKRGYISDLGLSVSRDQIKYQQYVSEISNFSNRNYNLGPGASKILLQFANHPYISTYQIFSLLKKRGDAYKLAYKNVHKRIQKLLSLNLIEKVDLQSIRDPLKESIHNPTYYRLSTGGLFHLIYKETSSLQFLSGTKKMFQNYSQNIIFKTLLYPYFKKQTLLKMNTLMVFTEILSYLNKCCAMTNKIIESSSYKNGGVIVMPLLNWENPGEYDEATMGYLTYEYNLGFKEKPKIKKIGETIEILSKDKSAFIWLDKKNGTAILTTADKKTYELGVETSNDSYKVGIITGTYREASFKQLIHGINYSLLDLATSIIMRVTEKDYEAVAADVDIVSFKVLSHDRKLMSLLKRTKRIFEERYQALTQLKNET
jgi:hypothetical protein